MGVGMRASRGTGGRTGIQSPTSVVYPVVCNDRSSRSAITVHGRLLSPGDRVHPVAVEDEHDRRMREIYVLPFYMQLPRNSAELGPSVAAVGRRAPLEDIIELLDSPWGERQVGAWFSIVRDEPEILPAVLESLRTSLGSLTTPELAMAAVLLGGEHAVPALLDYQAAETERKYGVSGGVSSALEFVGAGSLRGSASDLDRAHFKRHLDVANEIRRADTTVKATATALITRLPAFKNRPPYALGTRTMSFLLVPQGAETGIGCVITPKPGSEVIPAGRGIEVDLEFWAADARARLPRGAEFALKYGRNLGTGHMTS
jgi:hypothetical protein